MTYDESGRAPQKRRTRAALVASARQLVSQGLTPTVEQTATNAGISRTTAYRYFSSQRALLLAAHPEIQATSLLPPDAPDDPAVRFQMAVDAFIDLVAKEEPQLRTMLRLSLEPGAVDRPRGILRQGRGVTWIDDALSPLRPRLPPPALRKLVLAVRAAVGVEALVWLKDIAGLSQAEATEIMRWSSRAIYQVALSEIASEREE